MSAVAAHPKKTLTFQKRIRRAIAGWSRWLHIYGSMFGLVTILFFSVTGLTLNHPDWFFAEQTKRVMGKIDASLLNQNGSPPSDWDESDFSHQIAKLEVAEFLRAEHRLAGIVSDFLAFEDECEVTFEGPGYAAIARIQRGSGDYDLDITANDLVTVMNDLHKGRHAGFGWSLLIDFTAVIGTFVAITGFVLIFFLKLRRVRGTMIAIVGAITLGGFYWLATS